MLTTVSPSIEIPINIQVKTPPEGGLAAIAEIIHEELDSAARDVGRHVVEQIKDVIDKEDIYNEGTLYQSITHSVRDENSVIAVLVGTALAYARYVEYGTIPHFVPFHIAKSLYNQAKNEWGWQDAPVGRYFDPRGKLQTYKLKDQQRMYLIPPGGRPVWGVFVSGEAQPFMWPGWEASLDFIEERLRRAGQTASERINSGGSVSNA